MCPYYYICVLILLYGSPEEYAEEDTRCVVVEHIYTSVSMRTLGKAAHAQEYISTVWGHVYAETHADAG